MIVATAAQEKKLVVCLCPSCARTTAYMSDDPKKAIAEQKCGVCHKDCPAVGTCIMNDTKFCVRHESTTGKDDDANSWKLVVGGNPWDYVSGFEIKDFGLIARAYALARDHIRYYIDEGLEVPDQTLCKGISKIAQAIILVRDRAIEEDPQEVVVAAGTIKQAEEGEPKEPEEKKKKSASSSRNKKAKAKRRAKKLAEAAKASEQAQSAPVQSVPAQTIPAKIVPIVCPAAPPPSPKDETEKKADAPKKEEDPASPSVKSNDGFPHYADESDAASNASDVSPNYKDFGRSMFPELKRASAKEPKKYTCYEMMEVITENLPETDYSFEGVMKFLLELNARDTLEAMMKGKKTN